MAESTLTVAAAAEALGVTPRRVRALIATGQLDARRHGVRTWAIDPAAIERAAWQRPPRSGGRPSKQRRESGPALEVAIHRDSLPSALAAALRGLPIVDVNGGIVSPQIVAFAAGLAAARARRGVYRVSDGVDVSVDGGTFRVRIFEGEG